MTSQVRNRIVQEIFGKGGLSSAEDFLVFEEKCTGVRNTIRQLAPTFLDYFNTRIHRLLKQNLEASLQHPAAHVNWTNNNSESGNHILKMAINWRPKPLIDLINAIHEVVKGQYIDLQRAMIDRGNFNLCAEYIKFRMDPLVFLSKSKERRDAIFHKFMRTTKKRLTSTLTTSDGVSAIYTAPTGVKKPGQIKRKRCAKTTTTTTTTKQ